MLALFRYDHPGGEEAVLRRGLGATEIHARVSEWWPKNVEQLGAEDFVAFLDEMVDLGVLSRYGPNHDRYGLRSAQVAQMLGRREEIEDQILHIAEREPNVDYDSASFHRRIALDDPVRRAPVPDRLLADLFDSGKPGPRIVVAAPALWGEDVAEQLVQLAHSWEDQDGQVSALLHNGRVAALREVFARVRKGRQIVVLPPESEWDRRGIEWLAGQPMVQSGAVLPICIADPDWLVRHRLDAKDTLPAKIVTLRPWGDAMLRAWLTDRELRMLDHRPIREKLLRGTGGGPVLVARAYEVLTKATVTGNGTLDGAVENWLEAQRLAAHEVGLTAELYSLLETLRDLVDQQEEVLAAQDLEVLHEAMHSKWTGSHPVPKMECVLQIFADLGLIQDGAVARASLALTPLGHLILKEQGAS